MAAGQAQLAVRRVACCGFGAIEQLSVWSYGLPSPPAEGF